MLGVVLAFCAGTLFGFAVLGYRVTRMHRDLMNLELPLDSLVTFVMYDDQGNELTERTLVSVGVDGSNQRPIVAPVIRTGAVHHGVVYIGECGAVLDLVSGQKFLTSGDQYVILPGNWNTNLETGNKPSE